MIYMGSKNRIAKYILPIMLKDIGNDFFIDMFCGGGNLIQHANCKNKMAVDINPYTIAFLNKIKENIDWIPKNVSEFTKDDYIYVKNHKNKYHNYYLGHIGYNLSFGGKWFGGWCSNANQKDYVKAGYEHALRQSKKIKDVEFVCSTFFNFELPLNAVIYCDPPYKNTTKYNQLDGEFNHEQFYNWCKMQKEKGHQIFISEYSMPDDFKCVWEKEIPMMLDVKSNSNKAIERLFTL